MESESSANMGNILALDENELKGWLRRCLEGKGPYHFDPRVEQEPYELVLYLHRERADEDAARKLSTAIVHIFREICESPVDHTEVLYQALTLIDKLTIGELAGDLHSLIGSGVYKGLMSGDIDLHQKALLVLSSIQESCPQSFWHAQMEDPRYVGAAYNGLLKLGLSEAASALPLFMQKRREGNYQVDVRFPLYYLLDTHGPDAVEKEIGPFLCQMSPEDAKEIEDFLTQEARQLLSVQADNIT